MHVMTFNKLSICGTEFVSSVIIMGGKRKWRLRDGRDEPITPTFSCGCMWEPQRRFSFTLRLVGCSQVSGRSEILPPNLAHIRIIALAHMLIPTTNLKWGATCTNPLRKFQETTSKYLLNKNYVCKRCLFGMMLKKKLGMHKGCITCHVFRAWLDEIRNSHASEIQK